jgi:hypothetical protein
MTRSGRSSMRPRRTWWPGFLAGYAAHRLAGALPTWELGRETALETGKGARTERLWHTRGKELCLGRVGSLALVVTGDDWTDTAWREYCDLYSHMVVHHGSARGVFNFSPRHGPTSSQRSLLFNEYYRAHRIDHIRRFVLMTNSPVVRGIVTALSWFARGEQQTKTADPARAKQSLAWVRADVEFNATETVATFAVMLDVVGHRRDLLPADFWALDEDQLAHELE